MPIGRYEFNKLPFGITSAPEISQRRMSQILSGLPGTVCPMDDVLVHSRSKEERNQRLTAVLKRMVEAGVTLNREKCSFGQMSVKFLGHIVNQQSISADPEKTRAIRSMESPINITELQRFLGLAN